MQYRPYVHGLQYPLPRVPIPCWTDIVKYFPSPENREVAGISLKTNEIYHADYDFSKSKSAYIWKTIVDPFIGKYSLIKVNSGVIKDG